MGHDEPSTPHAAPAASWLQTHAGILFAAVRRVVGDSLCAYDLGLELSALIGHRWNSFDPGGDGTRMAWALRLAIQLVDRAAERGAVPTGERCRGAAEPEVRTLSREDLHQLSELARTPLDLDDDAGDALAAMERSAPSPGMLSRLAPSGLVTRLASDVREDG
ncbi:MAG: hypothetical protein H0U25_00305 [Thermoleophilaceae bacterium]|jgi:hypothetical protein|nr:hypothetical protein [Thermoleophilaceae bacterium]